MRRQHSPPSKARWFSLRLDRAAAPDLFPKETAKQVVASFELLPTLLCVVLFCPLSAGRQSQGSCHCTGGTDNQGNSFVVARGLTSKFPLCAVMMQMATTLELRGMWLDLYWLPRERNQAAGALTNADFLLFDPVLRIDVSWPLPELTLMHRVLRGGADLYKQVEADRLAGSRRGRARKTARAERLRNSDPW